MKLLSMAGVISVKKDSKRIMFEFNEATHSYTLDGKPLTGVTTILGVIAKPALIQWSANEAVKHIRESGQQIIMPGPDDEPLWEGMWEVHDSVLDEARVAHRIKKESAGDVGTEVHKAVEEWILNQKEPELNDQGMKMFNNFKTWATENKVKFLASEQQVYSRKHWYAGTYDFICEIDGKKYVGDLKTSSGIYGREYFAQCAAYRLAYNEMTNSKERSMLEKILGKWPEGKDPFHGVVVVRCGKKGDFEVKYSYDYKTDKSLFLSALTIYRCMQTFIPRNSGKP